MIIDPRPKDGRRAPRRGTAGAVDPDPTACPSTPEVVRSSRRVSSHPSQTRETRRARRGETRRGASETINRTDEGRRRRIREQSPLALRRGDQHGRGLRLRIDDAVRRVLGDFMRRRSTARIIGFHSRTLGRMRRPGEKIRHRHDHRLVSVRSSGKSRVEQAMVLRRRGRESTLGFIVRRVRRHRDSTSRRRRRSVSAYELRFDGRGAILRMSDRPPPLFSSFTRSITIRTTTTTPTTRNEMK
jgi:hypothetical protein